MSDPDLPARRAGRAERRPARRGRPRPLTVALVALVVLALLAVIVSALQNRADGEPEAVPSATPTPTPTATPTPTTTADPDPWTSVIATASGEAVDVFDEAEGKTPARAVTALEAVSLPGQVPLTFLVLEQRPDWLQVVLPIAPAGSTGWIRASDVTLTRTDLSVEVRLGDHRLVLRKADQVLLDVPVGLGQDEVPVPGRYFLKELLQPPAPGGVYGAYAYGLSGHPPVLEALTAGAGVIGIHGTNDPASVGTTTTHGCIFLLDADVTRLVQEFGLPLGTPVDVVG